MPTKVRLAICHRNRLMSECLTSALEKGGGLEITIVDQPSTDTLLPPRQDAPALLLIDAGLPDMAAFRLVQALKLTNESPRTILVVSTSAPEAIESCLRSGADGCVLEEDTLDDLQRAIECVLSGRSYCSPQVARRLFAQADRSGPASLVNDRAIASRLTRREVEILRLIAQRDLSNKQIARELHLSIFTVKNHVHSIIEKLSVDDRRTAVRHAIRHGLLADRAY